MELLGEFLGVAEEDDDPFFLVDEFPDGIEQEWKCFSSDVF